MFASSSFAGPRDRLERVFVDRATGDVEVRDVLVEEPDQRPHEPALRLALLAEEQHVVPGEHRDADLGDDGVVVADDAGEQRSSPLLRAARKLSRSSCLTDFDCQPLSRSCLRVVGRGAVMVCPCAGWVARAFYAHNRRGAKRAM